MLNNPTPDKRLRINTIRPVIHGTTSILTSALAVPTINRIVITSSEGAILGEDENAVYDETPLVETTVYVEDVANVHILALTNEKISKEGGDFVLDSGDREAVVWDDALEILRRRFPEAVGKGVVPCTRHTATKRGRANARRVETTFGVRFRGFEEQVLGVVGQYISLMEKSEGGK